MKDWLRKGTGCTKIETFWGSLRWYGYFERKASRTVMGSSVAKLVSLKNDSCCESESRCGDYLKRLFKIRS